jgi:MFS family permease
LTAVVFFLNGLGIGVWAASIPSIKDTLHLSNGRLSFALFSLAAGAVIMMPMFGLIASRYSTTGKAMTITTFLFAVALISPATAGQLPELIVATFLLGAATGAMDVAMNAHASAVEKELGSAIMSSFHAAYSVGALVGAGLGAVELNFNFSHHWLLLPAGLVIAGAMAVMRNQVGAGNRGQVHNPQLCVPERGMIGLAATALFCMLVEGAMVDWSALYLSSAGASVSLSPLAFGVFSVAMIAGRIGGDAAVRRIGRAQIIIWGALAAAAGLILAVAVPSIPAIIGGFAMVGIGLSNIVPAVFSESANRGTTAASGIAVTATAGYAGLLLGPALIGVAATDWNLRVGVAIMAVAAMAAAIAGGYSASQARNSIKR